MANRRAFIVTVCLLAGSAGCGPDGPELGDVTGVVTLDGEPLPTVEVVFQPVAAGRPSSAFTDANGRFTMVYRTEMEGALVGKQEVFLRWVPPVEVEENPDLTLPPSRFPRKYEQVFDTVEVVPGGNEFKFELTSH